MSHAFLSWMETDSLITDVCGRTAAWWSKMHGLKSLILSSQSFLAWGNELVAFHCSYNTSQYIYFGRIRQCNPVIAKCVWLKLVDTHNKHMQTIIVHSVIVRDASYSYQWLSILHFSVLSVASRSFVASQFLINHYSCNLSDRWHGHTTFLRFRPGIYGM